MCCLLRNLWILNGDIRLWEEIMERSPAWQALVLWVVAEVQALPLPTQLSSWLILHCPSHAERCTSCCHPARGSLYFPLPPSLHERGRLNCNRAHWVSSLPPVALPCSSPRDTDQVSAGSRYWCGLVCTRGSCPRLNFVLWEWGLQHPSPLGCS